MWVSRAYAEWMECKVEEVEGHAIAEVIGAEAVAALAKHWEKVLQGERVEFEEEIPFRELGLRWINAVYTPTLDAQGGVDGWVATVLDITDRKKLEHALRNAVRRKDDFLATLAHELRNPLAPIRDAVVQLARADVAPKKREALREIIDRASTQLERLLDDLLQISRIKRGILALRKTKTDLRLAVTVAGESVAPQAESKRQAMTLPPSGQPVYVYGDPARLTQIFTNLLTNAVKFTPDEGHIEVAITIAETTATVTVRDDGIGIEADDLPLIFDTFAQVNTGAAAPSGLGLGLSITKNLVRLHEGDISVLSAGPGTGTEVTVQLPLITDQAPAERDAGGLGVETASAARRVLIVDDNVDAGDSLGMLLASEGHAVRVIAEGKGCIPAAREFRPDVILLDIGLPDLNGYEIATQIRAQRWDHPMVLVAVTGWDSPTTRSGRSAPGLTST